jgi:hypothetical protein
LLAISIEVELKLLKFSSQPYFFLSTHCRVDNKTQKSIRRERCVKARIFVRPVRCLFIPKPSHKSCSEAIFLVIQYCHRNFRSLHQLTIFESRLPSSHNLKSGLICYFNLTSIRDYKMSYLFAFWWEFCNTKLFLYKIKKL